MTKHHGIMIETQKNQQKSDRFSKNLTLRNELKYRDQPSGGSSRLSALVVPRILRMGSSRILKSTRIRAKTIRTRTRKKCTRTRGYDTRIRKNQRIIGY